MSTDSKTFDEGEPTSSCGISWDASVNYGEIRYSNHNRTATLVGKGCSIRTPFLSSGRHIFNVYLHKTAHGGIGIMSKDFTIAPGNWIGQDKNAWGTWDNVVAYHNRTGLPVSNQTKIKTGDIVTVDINLNKQVLNWAINGVYLSNKDIAIGIAKKWHLLPVCGQKVIHTKSSNILKCKVEIIL